MIALVLAAAALNAAPLPSPPPALICDGGGVVWYGFGGTEISGCYSEEPAVVLKLPPCGTPEAAKEKACQAWVVRREPVQPADEWPPYERKSMNLLVPAPRPQWSTHNWIIPAIQDAR